MQPIPSPDDLLQLGHAIDRDGLETHDAELCRVIQLARDAGASGAAIDVLLDIDATEVMRLRAFASVARRWAEYRRRIEHHQEPANVLPLRARQIPSAELDDLRISSAHRRWAQIG